MPFTSEYTHKTATALKVQGWGELCAGSSASLGGKMCIAPLHVANHCIRIVDNRMSIRLLSVTAATHSLGSGKPAEGSCPNQSSWGKGTRWLGRHRQGSTESGKRGMEASQAGSAQAAMDRAIAVDVGGATQS
eukprot:scaffold296914_cov33-Tisochrysis_lutea.AAC.1